MEVTKPSPYGATEASSGVSELRRAETMRARSATRARGQGRGNRSVPYSGPQSQAATEALCRPGRGELLQWSATGNQPEPPRAAQTRNF